MPFEHTRTIHFGDTDAAGVVFFARYYAICHEAYEASLRASGIELARYFTQSGVVIPIAASEARYRRPLVCGDLIQIQVRPESLGPNSFAVHYAITKSGTREKLIAQLRTEHVCILASNRERCQIPQEFQDWFQR